MDDQQGQGQEQTAKRAARRRTLNALGVEGIVVTIPILSKVVGVPRSTLYFRISKGTFFLPIRDLHGSPVVMVDDLLDWMEGRQVAGQCKAEEIERPSADVPSERQRGSWLDRALTMADSSNSATRR